MGKQSTERLRNARRKLILEDGTRLYDRLLDAPPVDAVISIDNCEEYCFEHGKVFETWKDFPMIRPPFDEAFVECAEAKQPLLCDLGIKAYGLYMKVLDASKHATLLRFRDHFADMYSRVLTNDSVVDPGGGRKMLNFSTKQVFKGATHLIYIELIADWFSEPAMVTSAFIPIDETGAYTKTMILYTPWCVHKRCREMVDPYWRSPNGNDFSTEYIHTMFSVIMMGMSLANCKNVLLVEKTPDPSVSKRFKDLTGRPMTRYQVITIRSMGVPSTDRKPQQHFDVMPLHLRRGNFAHYSTDAPLFGKYTGTFWRPATVVGNEKNGMVVKDYKVQA